MTTHHTPAPWLIEYDNADERGGGQWYTVGPAKVHFGYGSSLEEVSMAEDDAALIAATPDLLAALQYAVNEASAHPKRTLGNSAFLVLAYAAIAKAYALKATTPRP